MFRSITSLFLFVPFFVFAQQDSLPDPIDIELLPSNNGSLTRLSAKPQFPGGDQAMKEYLRTDLRYPEAMREAAVEGATQVAFTITASGELENIRVPNGTPEREAFDQEALRVVRAMPRWEPAHVNGIPIPMDYVLPVTFRVTH